MEPYRVLVTIEILQLARLPRGDRDRILRFLEALGRDPGRRGDCEQRDEAGRPIQIKVIGNYALTYWADHGVKEIKIIKSSLPTRLENAAPTVWSDGILIHAYHSPACL